jgi:hypothetical protein
MENLTVAQILKKFPTFPLNPKIIIVFKRGGPDLFAEPTKPGPF